MLKRIRIWWYRLRLRMWEQAERDMFMEWHDRFHKGNQARTYFKRKLNEPEGNHG